MLRLLSLAHVFHPQVSRIGRHFLPKQNTRNISLQGYVSVLDLVKKSNEKEARHYEIAKEKQAHFEKLLASGGVESIDSLEKLTKLPLAVCEEALEIRPQLIQLLPYYSGQSNNDVPLAKAVDQYAQIVKQQKAQGLNTKEAERKLKRFRVFLQVVQEHFGYDPSLETKMKVPEDINLDTYVRDPEKHKEEVTQKMIETWWVNQLDNYLEEEGIPNNSPLVPQKTLQFKRKLFRQLRTSVRQYAAPKPEYDAFLFDTRLYYIFVESQFDRHCTPQDILSETKEVFQNLKDADSTTPLTYALVLSIFTQYSDHADNDIANLIHEMKVKRIVPDQAEVSFLISESKNGPTAASLLQHFVKAGALLDAHAYAAVVSRYFKELNKEVGSQLAEKYLNDTTTGLQESPDALHVLLVSAADAGEYTVVAAAFSHLKNLATNNKYAPERTLDPSWIPISLYTLEESVYRLENHPEEIEALLRALQTVNKNFDVHDYNLLFSAAQKANTFDLGAQLYREMQQKNVKNNPLTYFVLLDLLGHANRMSEAATLIECMRADPNLPFGERFYLKIVEGFLRNDPGSIEAKQWYQEYEQKLPDLPLDLPEIRLNSHFDFDDKGEEAVRKSDLGVKIRGLEANGQIDKALSLFEDIVRNPTSYPKNFSTTEAFNHFLPLYGELIKAGHNDALKRALEVYESMDLRNPPNLETFTKMLHLSLLAGNIDQALTFYDQIMKKKVPSLDVFRVLLSACEKHGRNVDAELIRRDMEENGLYPSLFKKDT